MAKLGKGGYGVVLAESESVAIKRFNKDSSALCAIREILLTKSCCHDSVIKYSRYELLDDEIRVWMKRYNSDVSEYITRFDINKNGIRFILKRVAIGLSYLHSRGIIHADLTPGNILMDFTIDAITDVVIADLGISALTCEKYHSSHVQTRYYRAPEISCKGTTKFSTSIDIWSLGCIIYQLVTKQVLFKNTNETYVRFDIARVMGVYDNDPKKVMKNLKALPYESILKFITENIEINKKDAEPTIVNIITRCLYADKYKRITADEILNIFGIMRPNAIPITVKLLPADELTVTRNIPENILSKCTEQLLNTAEQIYTKLNENEEIQLSCLYIAACCYYGSSADGKILKEFCKKRNEQELYRLSIEIMHKTNFVL